MKEKGNDISYTVKQRLTETHDLEGYFESPALRGFQNNLFLVLARKNGG